MKDKGCYTAKILILTHATDSSQIYSKRPHTDYDYKFMKKNDGKNQDQYNGWTALVSLSHSGYTFGL
jgi:hypothetical protein